MGRSRRGLGVAAMVAAAALAAVVTVLAASGDRSVGDDAAAPTPQSSTTAPPTDPPPAEPKIEVLDPGSQPRRPVRLDLEAGTRAVVRHTTDVAVVQRSVQGTQRLDPPAVTHVLRYTVRRVDDGVAQIDAVIDEVEVTDAELAAALAPLAGLRSSFELDQQGRASLVTFEIPEGASATLRSQLHQLEEQAAQFGALLPTAPIGAGARWRATTNRTLDGVTSTVVTTFTATELTDEALRYRTEVTVRAPEQRLELGPADEPTSATLRSSTLAGTGSGTLPLRTVGAGWTTEISGTQQLTVDESSAVMEVSQDVTITNAALPSDPL